ncbi:Inosine-5'-monophosphate dehydrogenase [Roseibacterium elongatum DSM 19469]|uniref:Inosine-5'-monophosphate dehydrogenase n=1 Tax=Roseicyclus elongatus DSM 19469 TaxID=1294273 RepID=W8SS81_9RHOB|nr:CBS domain-containing protein [Roseibacterium elongatum]AHM05385.1 Inosine-5'-monophosphate dehydrogenase [Roseibacterium elongatum DSM 19469]
MIVQQILKAKSDDGVVTLPPGTTVEAAAKMLASRRIGAIVVSPDGKSVAGIVSERDIVREVSQKGVACMADTVDSMMTTEIVDCALADTSDAVLARMTQGRFRHMPVIEAGEMVGLISIGDVVKAQLQTLEMEKSALEGMIKGF